MNQLKMAITDNKQAVDRFLHDFFEQKQADFGAIDAGLADLLKSVGDQTLRSGKRIRPFLVRQGYELAGGKARELAVQLGAGIELLHQYFLVHDDIVDRDEKRYGQDSLHEAWRKRFHDLFGKDDEHLGVALGLIGGDLLHSMAVDVVLQLPVSEKIKQLLHAKIHQTVYATVGGWQIHFMMNYQPIERVTKDDYLKGMELVSARYTFIDPLHMGLLLGENVDLSNTLTTYGRLTGMVFQIRDDILGMFGNSNEMGKPVGNDYREGKKTLLVLDAYKNATNEQKKFIKSTLGTNIDQSTLESIREIIKQTGALEQSEKMAQDYIDQAQKSLETIALGNTNRVLLSELADFVLARSK